jgi:hypothetical protein
MRRARIDRTNIGTIHTWLRVAAKQTVSWNLDESFAEGELVDLARAVRVRRGASSLLQVIANHPAVQDYGLHTLTDLALSADDVGVLNAIVTLKKTPTDILLRLQNHPSRSVRDHVRENLKHRRSPA